MPEIDRQRNLTKFAASAQTASLMSQATTIEFATRVSHNDLPAFSGFFQKRGICWVFLQPFNNN